MFNQRTSTFYVWNIIVVWGAVRYIGFYRPRFRLSTSEFCFGLCLVCVCLAQGISAGVVTKSVATTATIEGTQKKQKGKQ